MIKANAFRAIESSLAARLAQTLDTITAPVWLAVDAALEAGDKDKARLELGALQLGVMSNDLKFVEYVTSVAMLFGASRVTQAPGTSVVGMGFEQTMTTQAAMTMVQGLITTLDKALKEKGASYIDSYTPQAPVQKADEVDSVLRPFTSFMDKAGRAILDTTSSLHTSRVSAYGFTSEAEALGLLEYQINEQLDTRTCPICRSMHGRRFKVSDARRTLDTVLRVSDPEQLKDLQPWPDQAKESIATFRGLSEDELVQSNWHIPPFHPRCRGLLARVGMVKPLSEPPRPERYESSGDDFKALGINMQDTKVAYWNRHVGLHPAEVVARMTGVPTEEFLLGLATAENPKEYAGLKSLTVSKGITISLSKAGFGSEEAMDQTIRIIPDRKSLQLTSLDLDPSDQARGIVKKYMTEMYMLSKDMGLAKMELYAGMDVGGYAWAKYGFAPTLESWEALKKGMGIRAKAIGLTNSLSDAEEALYNLLMASKDPTSIFVLSDVTFGKALLLGQTWLGGLDLSDPVSATRFLSYIGALK